MHHHILLDLLLELSRQFEGYREEAGVEILKYSNFYDLLVSTLR